MTVTADLVIHNGIVVSPDAALPASVAIKDEKILAVGAAEAMPPARETLDAKGLHILPGAIDVHVHFRDPGYPHKEDWESGTAAAAFGGVTTVFDMPNTIPPTGNAEILAAKHKIAAAKAHVDFGLYGLLGEDTIEQCAGTDRRRGDRLQALYGQHLRQDSVALDRRHAGSLRGGGGDRKAHLAACRDQFDHGAAADPADGGGPARSAGAYRLAAGGGRDRGGEPRLHPLGMDRRAHPHPAHFLRRRIAAAARSQGARRRRHRRDLSAISVSVDRRLCALRRRHPRQSAGAREGKSGADLGRA